MGHRDTLGCTRRPGREDDPGIVADERSSCTPPPRRSVAADQALFGDDTDDTGLAEHQCGALVGIVGVHRHVGGAGGKRGQDGDVQRVGAGRHSDPDAVTAADAARGQPRHALFDVDDQLGIGELHLAVVDRRCVGMPLGGGVEDVDQRPWWRGRRRQQVLGGDVGSRVGRHEYKLLSVSPPSAHAARVRCVRLRSRGLHQGREIAEFTTLV